MPKLNDPPKKYLPKHTHTPLKSVLVLEIFQQEECPLLSGKLFLGGAVMGEVHLLRNTVPTMLPLLKKMGVVIEVVEPSHTKKKGKK